VVLIVDIPIQLKMNISVLPFTSTPNLSSDPRRCGVDWTHHQIPAPQDETDPTARQALISFPLHAHTNDEAPWDTGVEPLNVAVVVWAGGKD
jgi:hypothetical protein